MSEVDEIHAAHLEIEQQRIAEMEHVVEVLKKWDNELGDARAAIAWNNPDGAVERIIKVTEEMRAVIKASENDIAAVKGDDNDGTD